ncbi:MAG: DUF3786 domain-containing protein [Lachnospiraceae bacterium]|nr:DUF3786 domain-containing protein [Lachnospiraceae bacterium]
MEITYDKDNKERVPFEHYLAEYEKADPEEISVRTGFPWKPDKNSFQVKFLGVEYLVSFPKFEISPLISGAENSPLLSMNAAKILVIRFLLEGCVAESTGKFLTYREVPWGEVYYRQFNGRCMMRLAYSYGNRLDAFRSAMEKLGAQEIKAGDAGYEIELFEGFRIRFQLWAADDEFPPSAQILFSDNFAAVFHAEDLVVACDVIIGAMKAIK